MRKEEPEIFKTTIHWCEECKTPIINESNKNNTCTICGSYTKYLSKDIRPVFPEERLLVEILIAKPFEYLNKSVWASQNKYFIDGEVKTITAEMYQNTDVDKVKALIEISKVGNNYVSFDISIKKFIDANRNRLNLITNEAFEFINTNAKGYKLENVVVTFSGGKDSTVTSDLVIRGLSNPSIVHVFCDTTLEIPTTYEYVERFKKENHLTIFKTAKNKEQDFLSVCKDIGPPARMLRWCCYMFKTGPITRTFNSLYNNESNLSFYGVRKNESVSRSKYKRVESNPEVVKINNQTVASPIFDWIDIEIWLYILSNSIDFNYGYRLGYDRIGCYCCPNNNSRSQFLGRIYMSEKTTQWRDYLVSFSKSIGKENPELYVDSGNWTKRYGGNGIQSSEDVKIKYTGCTAEENAKIYKLNKPLTDEFLNLFIPFGRVSKDLGRKILNEVIVLDYKTNIPIISIQAFSQGDYENAVKIKTINVADVKKIERMISYQIRKYNACRQCLKCESICKFGAIKISKNAYIINDTKCTRCKMCVTDKYIGGGCLMKKYLATKE